MQRKLKSVFRSSKSKSSPDQHSENNTHYAEASSPRNSQHRISSDRHGRTSVDSSVTGSVYTGRSRPVSSVYNDHRQSQASREPTATTDPASRQFSDPNGGAIANDYKAYLPVLSPVDDSHGDGYITKESDGQHEEDVADRNIARYSTSMDAGSRDLGSVGIGGSVRKPADSRDTTTNGSLDGGVRPHADISLQKREPPKGSSSPPTAARIKAGGERSNPQASDSHDGAARSQQGTFKSQEVQSAVRYATVDGTLNGEETELARQLRKDGIVDLRNTVHTDGDITWAPAVAHEVIKPHQHEIVQQKIYREIHNYEYFHRIQPVMMTEVLPPRHYIPNPEGEGLIEISADELPARTGDNRWWSICEHSSPYSLQGSPSKYRTEPEIIEAGTFMTKEGFERKETIIVHPPQLADLSGYAGPVQAVHFDHKTGERWIGELTTMDKLHELQQALDRAPDAQAFRMDELSESLPKVPPKSMPSRKPVSGHSSFVHGSNAGRQMNVA